MLGPGANLGANLGATVEPGAKVIPKAAYRMYVPCPLMDPHLEEE